MHGLLEEFGSTLLLIGRVLTDDVDAAEELVIQAIVSQGDDLPSLREASAAVYIAWQAWDRPSSARSLTDDAPDLLRQIFALDEVERSALALCAYGGHTHRQAADVLDLPPDTVARLLGAGMRKLAEPRDLSPAA